MDKEGLKDNFFVITKFGIILFFLGASIFLIDTSIFYKIIYMSVGACFLMLSICLEWCRGKKGRLIIVFLEGILSCLGVFLFPVIGRYFLLIFLLDSISFHKEARLFLAATVCSLTIDFFLGGSFLFNIIVTFLITLIYFQEKIIIRDYKKIVREAEDSEESLKLDIARETKSHEKQMKKNHLEFENAMLEEKGRISQALHDKLGHSINGSLYKLEAAKLLLDKDKALCEKNLQDVIDNLRESMDEIRTILRNERPDKKRTALLSLRYLCEECEEKYDIKASLNIEDSNKTIPEKIWEIILDNTYEAVTNALKYAKCTRIDISIWVLNELVRCTICDDGVGAAKVTPGMGLQGMKKRVKTVNGYIDIESEAGFKINMLLPLDGEKGMA